MRDLMGLMKQAQELQGRMQEMQAEIEALEVEGTAGAGLVSVGMTAKGVLKSVRIDPSLLKPEEVEILEDLLIAAHNDARGKAEALVSERMQSLAGGLPLPPGFKLPF